MPQQAKPEKGTEVYRSFIAIPLQEALKRKVAAVRKDLQCKLPQVRWAPLENLHLTLRFLGDQTEETLEQIALSMLSVGRLSSVFTIHCRGLGVFPSARRARILWLGLEPASPLVELHQRLSAQMKSDGFPAETARFRPHLTLGRVRHRPLDLRNLIFEEESIDCGEIEATEMILYESRPLPSGAQHLPRVSVRLGAL